MKFDRSRFVKYMILRFFGIAILGVILVSESLALDPNLSVSQYRYRSWNQDSGLMVDAVNLVTVSEDGKVWLGTSQGIGLFDGLGFREIKPEEGSIFEGKIVSGIYPRKESGILFTTEGGGLGFSDQYGLKKITPDGDFLDSSSMSSLLLNPDGSILIGGIGGLRLFSQGAPLKELLTSDYIAVISLFRRSNGNVLVGTASDGIYEYDGEKVTPVTKVDFKDLHINAILEDDRGNFWIGTQMGLRRFDKDWETIPYTESSAEVKSLLQDKDGNIWIGTQGQGLFRFNDGNVDRITSTLGIAGNDVMSLVESGDGTLWVGTRTGLSQISQYLFPTYSNAEGLPTEGCLAVVNDLEGGVWIGTNWGIANYRDGAFKTIYGNQLDTDFTWIKHLLPTKNGDLYVFGANKNMDLLRNEKMIKSWVFEDWPNGIAEDADGNIVFGVGAKLMRLVNGEPIPFTLSNLDEVDVGWITDLLISPDKKQLWIGGAYGIYKIEDGKLFDYFEISNIPRIRCSTIEPGKFGGMWIAGRDGIAYLEDEMIYIMDSKFELPKYFINAIVADGSGYLWIDTNQGIIKVDEMAMIAATKGQSQDLDFLLFKGRSAMKTVNKMAYQHSSCYTEDGKVWIPTSMGVVVIDTLKPISIESVPKVEIEHIYFDGKPYQEANLANIPPGRKNLQIDYLSWDYVSPREIRYRYKLVGFDSDWVYAEDRKSAFYTKIPHGTYKFVVEAKYSNGDWNSNKSEFSFTIPPKFHERVLFRVSVLLIFLLLLAYLVWSYHVRREQIYLRKARDMLEIRVEERTLLLNQTNKELAHTAKKAQRATEAKSQFLANMSHELRTPMNAILGMNELLLETDLTHNQRELAEITQNGASSLLSIINDILDLSKLETGELDLHTVDFNLHETIEDTISLMSVKAAEKGLELACLFEHQLPAYWTGDVARLKQILLNLIGNAIKFTEKGQVVVRVFPLIDATQSETNTNTNTIRFEVEDTGAGIPPQLQQNLFQPFYQADDSDSRKHGGAGLGLAICKQIVQILGGLIGLKSSSDLGSTFFFELPLTADKSSLQSSMQQELAGRFKGKKVLCFSENSLGEEVTTQFLKSMEIDWEHAQNIAIGQAGCQEQFDLVFINVCNQDAKGALESFAEKCPKTDLPFVFLLPMNYKADDEILKRPNCFSVRKPTRRRDLIQVLSQALPLAQDVTSEGEGSTAIAADIRFKDMSILVVEDNAMNQKVVKMLLKNTGCNMEFASNGVEALDKLKKASVDLILMDCQMPEMNGFEATRRIRETESLKDCYIVALTASTMHGDKERCLNAGMNDYLSKPIVKKHLFAKVEDAKTRKLESVQRKIQFQ